MIYTLFKKIGITFISISRHSKRLDKNFIAFLESILKDLPIQLLQHLVYINSASWLDFLDNFINFCEKISVQNLKLNKKSVSKMKKDIKRKPKKSGTKIIKEKKPK